MVWAPRGKDTSNSRPHIPHTVSWSEPGPPSHTWPIHRERSSLFPVLKFFRESTTLRFRFHLDSPTASYRVSFPSSYWVSSCRFFFPTSYLEAFLPPPSWLPSLRFAGFSSLPLTGFPSLPPTRFPSFPLRGFLPSLIQGFLPSLLQGFLPSLRQGFLPSLRQGFLPSLIQGFLPSLIQGLIPFP